MAVRDGLMPRRQLPAELLLFSGSSHSELRQQLAEARDLVRAAEGRAVDLASLAYQVHRRSWHALSSRRVALVAESVEELKVQIEWLLAQVELDTRLASTAPPGVILGDAPSKGSPSIAFLFPGQGTQYPRMLDELAVQFSEVRLAFERLDRTLGRNISACVFPPPAFENDERSRQIKRLMATDVAQPALGATGVGLTRLLASFGVRPNMTGGHSYGELTALFAAGGLDEASLYRLSVDRAEAMLSCDGAQSDAQRGAMLAVLASEAAARSELAACDGVFLANVNGPRQVVIGGRAAAVRLAQQRLEARGIVTTPLAVNFAFHTPHMRPAGESFAAACARTLFQSPKQTAFCNVTAAAHESDVRAIRDRLVEHLTSPVRFAEMVEAMYEGGARLFVEVGPSDILSRLVGEILASRPHETIPLQAHGQSGLRGLLRGLARLFVAGVNVDADRLYEGRTEPELEGDSAFQRHSDTVWLVNGGYARPKDSPPPGPQPLVTVGTDRDALRPASRDVFRAVPSRARRPQVPVLEGSKPSDVLAAGSSSDGARAEVVLQFQRNMRELLEEQASILRQYLGASASVPADMQEGSRSDRARNLVRRPPRKRDQDQQQELLPPGRPAPRAILAEPAESEDLANALVRLTSEKTGYPPSALSLDARLEADLGIDSIKRLEIVAALRRQVAPEVTEPPPWFARRMVSAASLRDIVAGVQELKGHSNPSTRVMPAEALPEAKCDDPSPLSEDADGVCWRWMPTAVEAPPAAAADIPDGTLVVTDDRGGLAERFVQFCKARGRRAVLLHDEALESRASAASALDEIRAQGSLAGIVHLAPLSAAPVFPHMEDGEWQRRLDAEVKSLLFLAQALSSELTSRAESRTPTLLFAASVGGGQFVPQQRDEASHPWRGGLAGILKTAALEWPDARCRAADFDKPPDVITLWEELRMTGPVEIGYREQRRLSLSAVAAPLGSSRKEVSGLDSRSVFLITGGARGITAEVVKELSARTGATMVLLGRTEASSAAESEETAPIDDPIELRRVMARLLALQGLPPSPLQIDGAVKQLLAQREIRRTLSALEEIGSRARYIQCDVRSYESLERAVRSARAEFGEITGVLHGAGVIEDRHLLDKTAESFDLVVGTKLDPIRHLLKLLDSARVRHVLLFSSTAAFWGNPGQADYAAANEILNRIGRYLSETWPGKTTAIGWGPWSGGGMVTPEVAREFARRGIPLVPQAEGRIAAWRELSSPEREARVLIGRGPWSEVDPSRNGRIVRAREECRAEVPPTPPKGIVTEVTLSEAAT